MLAVDYGSCVQHAFSIARPGRLLSTSPSRQQLPWREHEQALQIGVAEVADIAGAARWSNPRRWTLTGCAWRRSYGLRALAGLTRPPGLFRLGIVIADGRHISLLGSGSDFWMTLLITAGGWAGREQHRSTASANVPQTRCKPRVDIMARKTRPCLSRKRTRWNDAAAASGKQCQRGYEGEDYAGRDLARCVPKYQISNVKRQKVKAV
jgi:hypothetical protein